SEPGGERAIREDRCAATGVDKEDRWARTVSLQADERTLFTLYPVRCGVDSHRISRFSRREARFDRSREVLDCGPFEQRLQWVLDPEPVADPRQNLEGAQRVAAEFEEIIVDRYVHDAELRRPHVDQFAFDRGAGLVSTRGR